MIAYIAHGNNVGALLDYLTNESDAKNENKKIKTEINVRNKTQNQERVLTEKSNLKSDTISQESFEGHLKYPRQAYKDDLDENYQPDQRWRIIGGTLSPNIKEAVKELEQIMSLRPNIKKPVWHASLSAHPDDKINSQQWEEIGKLFLDVMGIKDVPFIIIQHRDQEHDHIHIVSSRIDIFGNVNDGWREREHSQMVCLKIEQEFGLTKASREKSKRVKKIKQTYFEDSAKSKTIEKVEKTLTSMMKPNVSEFVEKLANEQILVEANISKRDQVLGLKFGIRADQNRKKYDEKIAVKERREKEKLQKAVKMANAESVSENDVMLTDNKPEEKNEIIWFAGGQLGDKYKWENLREHLNFTEQDKPVLKKIVERTSQKDFPSTENLELTLTVNQNDQSLFRENDANITDSITELNPEETPENPNHAATPVPGNIKQKSFFIKLRDYFSKPKLQTQIQPVKKTEKVSVKPEPEKTADPVPQKIVTADSLDKRQTKHSKPKISVFDLAVEKQKMAAEISTAFLEVNEHGFPLASDEILQLTDKLQTRSIYPEFFFDGKLISGLRFSKLHQETNEMMTFKGSELNIVILQFHRQNELIVKNKTATSKNLFSERILSTDDVDKLERANDETSKARTGIAKISRNTVLSANLIDEKMNKTFDNHFNGYASSVEDREINLIVLNRVKSELLKGEKKSASAEKKREIEVLQKNVDARINKLYEDNLYEDSRQEDNISIFSNLYKLRNQSELFNKPFKSELDADLLISQVSPNPDYYFDLGCDSIYEDFRDEHRSLPYPPIEDQQNNYANAIYSRLDELGLKSSEIFDSLLEHKLMSMENSTLIDPNSKYKNDLSDVLTPYGNLFLKTRNDIIIRDDWNKYDDKETFANELFAATFILANGNENEINGLLDHHISELQTSEFELVTTQKQESVIEQNVPRQLEM